ncbi:MAG: hypothetical protein Q9169_006936 [Polycauliona sp. 2 TL-2023]
MTLGSTVLYLIAGVTAWYFATSIWSAIYNLCFSPMAKFPGPRLRAGFHFPEAFSVLSGKSYRDMRQLHERYGSVVRVAPNALSFTTAQAWQDIYGFKKDKTELAKDPSIYGPDPNIAAANQQDHTRLRKIYGHAFTDKALLEQSPLLTRYADLLISSLKQRIDGPNGGRLNLVDYYSSTTYDVIADLTLGEPFGELETGRSHFYTRFLPNMFFWNEWLKPNRNIFEAIKYLGLFRFAALYPVVNLAFKLVPIVMPSLTARKEAHREFTKAKVEKRLDLKTDRKDFMAYVLEHNDGEQGMTRSELITNADFFIIAGSESTTTTVSAMTYYLMRNPDTLYRVQAEIRAAFATADTISLRSVRTPGLLPYLEAVIQETLRMFPPAPSLFPRKVGPAGAIIDGYSAPANVSRPIPQSLN